MPSARFQIRSASTLDAHERSLVRALDLSPASADGDDEGVLLDTFDGRLVRDGGIVVRRDGPDGSRLQWTDLDRAEDRGLLRIAPADPIGPADLPPRAGRHTPGPDPRRPIPPRSGPCAGATAPVGEAGPTGQGRPAPPRGGRDDGHGRGIAQDGLDSAPSPPDRTQGLRSGLRCRARPDRCPGEHTPGRDPLGRSRSCEPRASSPAAIPSSVDFHLRAGTPVSRSAARDLRRLPRRDPIAPRGHATRARSRVPARLPGGRPAHPRPAPGDEGRPASVAVRTLPRRIPLVGAADESRPAISTCTCSTSRSSPRRLPTPDRPALEPVRTWLQRETRREHERLADTLAGERVDTILDDWAAAIESDAFGRESSVRNHTVGSFAARVVARAHRRILRDGRAITAGSPDEALHDLRKRAKALRYLVDGFRGAFDRKTVKKQTRHLKDLQDNLGRHQDRAVQVETLRRIAHELDRAPPATFMALGYLVEQLDRDRHALRDEFAAHFEAYDAPQRRRTFERMLDAARRAEPASPRGEARA